MIVPTGYAMNGRTLTYAHRETWTWSGVYPCAAITGYNNWLMKHAQQRPDEIGLFASRPMPDAR